jgi:hypothetical protein
MPPRLRRGGLVVNRRILFAHPSLPEMNAVRSIVSCRDDVKDTIDLTPIDVVDAAADLIGIRPRRAPLRPINLNSTILDRPRRKLTVSVVHSINVRRRG